MYATEIPRRLGQALEARSDAKTLRVEVKGLSRSVIAVELTPNEYVNMKKHRHTYRICVVTNCLGKVPNLTVFSYSEEADRWDSDEGCELEITEVIAARMYAVD